MTVYIVHAHIVTDRATVIMAFLAKLLIAFTLLGSLSAAKNDDSQILSFSKQEITNVIDKLVRERIAEIESTHKKENDNLKNEISVLKSGFARLEVENRHLKSKVDSVEIEIELLKSAAPRTPLLDPENDTKVDEAFRRVAPDHPSAPQSVFKARMTHKLTNVGPDQIIKFDNAEMNIGNHYNPTTSVFTCDIPGVYVFHLAVMLYGDKYVELFFMRNGQEIHNVYVGNKPFIGSGSTMALIQLDLGDTVFINSDQYHSTGDLMYPNYSYFSGFLLYPRM